MDALTRRQFDRSMFAKERTLAIRVGEYASRDIKEASFEYGYIKGDTYKPGGTCAGSGKITFTSIITTFNKLDTLHPEIGLLVGDTYQWVKMGEYFINDIEIDRNRNTTTLELMDGMFKLNREYVTDLHFPAEVREVIQEICLKTGIELANDYFGISAMRYHIEQVPEGKKLSFRDMLSAMTQMIGMSCFFNREGKMEIRDLTESNITINADSYFLHGLTKSEIEYQIAGITCKTDKKSLTVGMKTGRSLELDNVFMTQSALNDLYYKLKNLTYYPYNLNYQGHLLLEVGQWVTIQTNKKETFKVPVLSQSFTFKGGLRGRISADSKAGNDTQYSYEGTITKHIKQQGGIEAKIQAQIEATDKDFDQKVDKIKKDFNDQVELAKARAEEVKRELSDTINQRFNSFDNGPLKETKRKAEEALRNAGASTLLAQEAKRIGLDSVARLEAFKSQTTSAQTALSGDLDALKRTIANDIRPKQAQAEAEIAKQVEALSRTKNELAGASSLLAQEAKRIELDSVARLEAFKSQTTSAQTALSGDLDVLKRTIANDIRPKQAQAETEIAKQVEALSRTKNELAGVKSAQATYEETTTRRLSELTNLANGKASKSELTQTAEELSSKIASVQASGRNLFLNSLFKQDISKTGIWTTSTYTAAIDSESKYLGYNALKIIGLNPSGRDGGNPKVTYPALGQFGKVIPGSTTNQDVTISFYAKANKNGIMLRSRLGNIGYKTGNVTLSTEIKRYVVHIPKGWTNESKQTTNEWLFNFNQEGTVWIWMPKFEISDVDTSYSEAPEDIEGQISTVESTFKQRANSLEAGVNRLTEGLRTKVDISALNVTAENIRQSVKSLETDTQNKLNQKLSQAEFEVRAGSIRQEILNATKDKASKSELTQTAEELASRIASVKVGGRNYYRDSEKIRTSTRFFSFPLHPYLSQENVGETWTLSFDLKINEGGEIRPLLFYHYQTNRFGLKASADITPSKEWQRFTFTGPVIFPNDDPRYSRGEMALYDHGGNNNYSVRRIKLEKGTLATDWSPAPEDIEGQISTVESTFKQRANSLEAGVNRLTEGLRTKVDISALNVTAENIRQSVKSLETDTQNKLNQKLSQAEFEVRAGSIRQEILNATKDKADKTLVVSEAGKLREEFSKMKVGGRNLWIKSKTVGAVIEKLPENHVTGQKECYRLENNSTLTFNIEPDFSSRLYQKVTFSAWVKYENVVQGRNFWNVFNCFKHYLFRKNSETGVQSGPDYATLGMYKGSADWKYITFTYDYSEKTNFDQLKTSLRFNLEGATSGTAWVTGIKVEIGSVATDWSPAPEDADGLITEAKATFERTAQGLRTDLSAIQEYVNKDGQRQEALQRYTREESTRQAIAVRELVNRDFVGKATYQEDVKGINQRIEAVKTSANKDIASQIASYRQSVDGKFTDISSQITTYKQDVGGQISGLSNRLTSSEQGTTTQISNLSNRINSNKQGADNQISNLKTQVATNKDNAERQMGRISDQVSANKANADSQFVNVTNQLARKVETTDFQRVKETSKLYERILGNTENGIADKVARMALTNQLFQVEVGKVAKGGRNYIRNGQFKNGSKNWLEYQSVNFGLNFNYQHSQNPNNRNRSGLHFYHDSQDVANFFGIQQSFAFDGVRGEKVSVSLLVSKDGGDSNSGLKVALHYIKNKNIIGQEWQNIPSPQITSKYKRFTFTFTLSDDVENLNLMLFGEKGKTINLYVTDVQLERGSVATDYKEAPEDTDEAIRSVQSQLTGSWAVQNINSAGDIISGINLGANGHNRFVGKLTHITGETLIDRAVIKSAMVDKLKTANFEAGSVTTTILDAEAVTADKVRFDAAFIRKMTANDAFIDQLTSGRIFSTKVESVISSSTFLEAYQGRIGGFTLGQFDQGGGRWISGVNQFSVGMGNGAGYGVRTAFWANWGNNWNYAGPKAWNVNTDGKMYCRNEVGFYDQVDFSNSSRANFYGNTTFSRSPVFSNGIELGSKDVLGDGWNPKGGRNAVVWWNQVGSGSVKYWMEQKSDRRLKENITDTAVKALDKINRLRMVAFDFIENKKHEEIGLIAQEAETIVPRIVSRDPENPDGYLHIDYTALVPYLIKAIQELNQKIEKMEKTIA
ncbi:tail fiber domain-containing protein [Streptococcus pneumoniae]|nr:tail fiber domain-containing protein [Streptococcus pneumoniae]MDS4678302.1 tail fiber domain-containing protein [Streptococcus pneumoniae]MDS5014041.1 tail fiber domain-containing protein [Streptococcus pneumoniae]MDS5486524.1 tail fiber domain-containing protein [Streptococcus pneumoniae]